MKCALAFLASFLLSVAGCSRPPAVPVAAAPPPPTAPQVQFKPATFRSDAVSAETVSNTVVTWESILVQFKVEDVERHGLAKVFEGVGVKNSVIERENARSPLAQLAGANTNISLRLASGPYAARFTFEESTNLIEYFHGAAAVDTMSQPRATTRGTNEVQMQVSNAITLVLDGGNSSDPAKVITTNIWLGHTVSLQLLGRSEDSIMIEASARVEEFHGYSEPNDVPRPIFAVSTMGTRTQLRTNEVLLLGGPIQMNVVKTVDRVAYLSDIPAIGRLFTEEHVHTNFVRTMVIVRPRVQ